MVIRKLYTVGKMVLGYERAGNHSHTKGFVHQGYISGRIGFREGVRERGGESEGGERE